jgi:hypothetical protein
VISETGQTHALTIIALASAFPINLEKAVEPRRARRPRRKKGEAWFLSPQPARELHRQGKVLFGLVSLRELRG